MKWDNFSARSKVYLGLSCHIWCANNKLCSPSNIICLLTNLSKYPRFVNIKLAQLHCNKRDGVRRKYSHNFWATVHTEKARWPTWCIRWVCQDAARSPPTRSPSVWYEHHSRSSAVVHCPAGLDPSSAHDSRCPVREASPPHAYLPPPSADDIPSPNGKIIIIITASTSAIHCWPPSIHRARPHGLELLAGWPPHTQDYESFRQHLKTWLFSSY